MTGALGLATLLRGNAAVFESEHWPERPFSAHGPVERFVGLHPQLASIDAILALPRHTLHATTIRDAQHLQLDAVADGDAHTLLAAGFTLLFIAVRSPILDSWIASIERDCRLLPTTGRVHCFVSRDRARTATHCDATGVFVVQLAGSKRWRVAPNRHVHAPTTRIVLGQPSTASATPQHLPDEMPADHETFDLAPGSVLFVPRGHWHDTQVLAGESLHLSFVARLPTWADALYFVLRVAPALDTPAWRELAPQILVDGQLDPGGLAALLARVPQLFELIRGHAISPDDLARACGDFGFY